MSKSGQEFERRLDLAKYDLYEALKTIRCGSIYDDCPEWLQEVIDKAISRVEGK